MTALRLWVAFSETCQLRVMSLPRLFQGLDEALSEEIKPVPKRPTLSQRHKPIRLEGGHVFKHLQHVDDVENKLIWFAGIE